MDDNEVHTGLNVCLVEDESGNIEVTERSVEGGGTDLEVSPEDKERRILAEERRRRQARSLHGFVVWTQWLRFTGLCDSEVWRRHYHVEEWKTIGSIAFYGRE